MTNITDNVHREASPIFHPPRRKVRPRTLTPEKREERKSGDIKKHHRRATTVVGISGEDIARGRSPSHTTTAKVHWEDEPASAPIDPLEKTFEKTEEVQNPLGLSVKDASPQPQPPLSDILIPDPANESEDSTGSNQTVTQASAGRRDSSTKGSIAKQRKHYTAKPNVLQFLDMDSPQITPESIQRTVKEVSKPSPDAVNNMSPSTRSISSTSSGFREDIFDTVGDHETDLSTSPEHSIDGDPRGRIVDGGGPRIRTGKRRTRSYGTPEMPRGNIHHPHVPPEELTPRAPNQHFVPHIPRPEKLPLTGYELLASRLSVTSVDRGGPPLRPIYRRFETLNHRLLLHLQDEIAELEEQLHRLDTTDTQNRCLPGGILPASRRADYISGGELQWHRTDILGKIGFKLEQYNRVLSSFRETLSLPIPTATDVGQYRIFLGNYAPVADVETQFLDATDDLVSLGYSEEDVTSYEYDVAASSSDISELRSRRRVSFLSQSDVSRPQEERPTSSLPTDAVLPQAEPMTGQYRLMHLSAAMAIAVILPILTFLVIPNFIGRMTVVCLVGTGLVGALIQSHVIKTQPNQEFCVSIGLYGVVMAILASMLS